jgi:hypothetical protein
MMTTQDGFSVERVGKVVLFSSASYRVTYPDGHVGIVWVTDDGSGGELHAAISDARRWYAEGVHKNTRTKGPTK